MTNSPYVGQNANILSFAPYSQEAEEAVIGAVLTNPEAFLGVASFLKAEDFYILRHSYIWEALTRITDRNDQIDFVTVQEELRAAERLNDIGGAAYLLQLINNTPTSVHAEVYGHLVERAAVRRRLLVAADEIKALALDEQLPIEKVTGESESRLFRVTERNLRRDLVPMREAINTYFDRIEHLMQHPDEPLGLPTGFRDLDELLGGLQRSDLLIFAGRPGMGKCVTGDTLIPTEFGLLPIEALKPDGEGIRDDEGGVFYPLELGVQTPDGMKYTSHFYDSGVKPTLRLHTRAGYTLTGTYVHPVLTLSKTGEKVWKQLCEVESGDFVAIQRSEAVWGNTTEIPDFHFKYNDNQRSMKQPTLPIYLTPELAYILGLLTGDGNLTRTNYVGFTSSDPELIDIVYQWTQSLGLHIRHRGNYDHQINSIVLNAWLKHVGLEGDAHQKEVPYTVLQAPQEQVRAFLQGLFDTDGHAELQHGYIQFVTTSPLLAQQVHLLLLQFGVVSKLTYKANKYRGAWSIRITGNAARIFYERVGFRLARKQARKNLLPLTANATIDVVPYLPSRVSTIPKTVKANYYRHFEGKRSPTDTVPHQIAEFAPEVEQLLTPEFYWDEVTEIADAGMQHCYDLTVPVGHTFVGNGIVSHNTSFLLSVALNAAKLGARILIFTMEMGSDQIVQRFVSMETGINTQKLRTGQLTPQEWSRFVQATGRLGNLRIFIDDSPAITPIQMRTKCRRIAHEFGLDLVIVDYMQLMNAGGGYENNRVQEISYISRSLKELARELNVPLFSAAQLSRAVEQRQDKRPQLSDLRESGCLAGDTLIFMPDTGTYTPIAELVGKRGFNVLSVNTETWKLERAQVSNAFCTGVKPVYKLTTRLGRRICATGNHKFLTMQGWKRLDELVPDDHIALPRHLDATAERTMSDAELALVGHLLGDGCTLPKHAIQYTTHEAEIAEYVASLAREVFGERLRPRICREPGRSWYQVFLAPVQHSTRGVHNPVRVWLENMEAFGFRSYEKRVPDEVFRQPAQAIAVFLRHLWTTDGCINFKRVTRGHYPTIYYATSSEGLAHDVQSLLLRLGINARLSRVLQGSKGRDQYHVTLSGQVDLTRFADCIGAVGEARQRRLQAVTTYVAEHTANTNRDVIPRDVWRMHAVPAMATNGMTTRQMQAQLGNRFCGTGLYKQNISRERAARLAEVVRSESIARLSHSDVYWDRIDSIEPDGQTEVFDLTVPGLSNFVANDCIVHNSIEQDADIVTFLYRDVVYNEATEFPNKADVIVAKHRNGPTGTIGLHFEKSLTKFSDARTTIIDLSSL